jgi:hypothetical protein
MLAMVTLGFGCATAEHIHMVESEYWKDENFTDYKSYAWIPSDAHRHAETQAEDHRLHDLIREAIDARLAERGFVRTHAPDADFLVTYHCKISKALRADLIDHTWYTTGEEGNWEAAPRRVGLSTFDAGSIVIDFARPDGARWVWRGVARGRVSPDATPEQLKEIVERSVDEILDEFPPPR